MNYNEEEKISNKFFPLILLNNLFIMDLLNKKNKLLKKQRFIMHRLLLLLSRYFPGLRFFHESNVNGADILLFAHEAGGVWSLDLKEMPKSDQYKHLFHKDFSAQWDEKKAIAEYGKPDIIKFCIDIDNEKFWNEFSILYSGIKFSFDKGKVRDLFLQKLKMGDKKDMPIYLLKSFDELGLNKTARNIYKAFLVEGYKIYTHLSWGVNKLGASGDITFEEYLEAGMKHMDSITKTEIAVFSEKDKEQQKYFYYIVNNEWPEKNKFQDELQDNWERDRAEFAQEILEMVPKGTSKYIPKTEADFIKQLKSGIGAFNNRDHNIVSLPLSDNDMQNLRNYLEMIKNYGGYTPADFFDTKKSTREKVDFLMDQVLKTSIGCPFSEEQRKTINEWQDSLSFDISLNTPVYDNDNQQSTTLGDFLEGHNFNTDTVEELLDKSICNIKEFFSVKHREGENKTTSKHRIINQFLPKLDEFFNIFIFSPGINILPGTQDYQNLKNIYFAEIYAIIDDERKYYKTHHKTNRRIP